MPLYEYQCDACGARFELIRKFSDPPLTTCPKCGQEKVRKLVSSPAFHLKGAGWYATDYARKSDEGSGSGGKAHGESKSEDKPETKPQAASDNKADTSNKGDTSKGSAASTSDSSPVPATSAPKDKP
jgi:putative FmdB family regulatory protein